MPPNSKPAAPQDRMPTCRHPAHPAHRPCGPRGQRLGIPSRGGGQNSRDQPGVQGEAALQLRPRERLRDPQGTRGSEAQEGLSAARPWPTAQTGGPEPTRRRGDASAGCGAHGLRGAETAHSGGPTLSGRQPRCSRGRQSAPSPPLPPSPVSIRELGTSVHSFSQHPNTAPGQKPGRAEMTTRAGCFCPGKPQGHQASRKGGPTGGVSRRARKGLHAEKWSERTWCARSVDRAGGRPGRGAEAGGGRHGGGESVPGGPPAALQLTGPCLDRQGWERNRPAHSPRVHQGPVLQRTRAPIPATTCEPERAGEGLTGC